VNGNLALRLPCAYPDGIRMRICRYERQPDVEALGLFEARYVAFLETITHLRPRLHRYCARMTGSVLDGEDVIHGSFRSLSQSWTGSMNSRALSPWLFRIAHNRCIDFLRRRQVRQAAEAVDAEAAAIEPDSVQPVDPLGPSPRPCRRTLRGQPSAQRESMRVVEGPIRLFA
jgi:RNA polymerase sigma factor (sigma-70 family)